jgi:NAD(P)-dependent dehydrogenase (short-subunit alcohol dehydrogenase family)
VRMAGTVTFITGGASGIGETIARLFAAEDGSVVIADVADELGEAVCSEVTQTGGSAGFAHCDVTNENDVRDAVAATVSRFGRLDAAVNCAGVWDQRDKYLETTEEVWNRVIDINLKGVFLSCKYEIPALVEAGGGSLINIGSVAALRGSAEPELAYAASKGGVISLTLHLAVEYARHGLRANVICPGPVETSLNAAWIAALRQNATELERRMIHIPLRRFGRTEEIAKIALFLASPDSSLMTGTVVIADGGIAAAYVT